MEDKTYFNEEFMNLISRSLLFNAFIHLRLEGFLALPIVVRVKDNAYTLVTFSDNFLRLPRDKYTKYIYYIYNTHIKT
jgi:hypothetical protein